MKEISSLHTQKWHLNVGGIVDAMREIASQFGNTISSILKSDSLDNDLYMLTYILGDLPEFRTPNIEKRSSSQDERDMKINDFIQAGAITPVSMKWLLKDFYLSRHTTYWSNGDDFYQYRFESVFEWRKFVIVFYNSSDMNRKKISFEELINKNSLVRVCWY